MGTIFELQRAKIMLHQLLACIQNARWLNAILASLPIDFPQADKKELLSELGKVLTANGMNICCTRMALSCQACQRSSTMHAWTNSYSVSLNQMYHVAVGGDEYHTYNPASSCKALHFRILLCIPGIDCQIKQNLTCHILSMQKQKKAMECLTCCLLMIMTASDVLPCRQLFLPNIIRLSCKPLPQLKTANILQQAMMPFSISSRTWDFILSPCTCSWSQRSHGPIWSTL